MNDDKICVPISFTEIACRPSSSKGVDTDYLGYTAKDGTKKKSEIISISTELPFSHGICFLSAVLLPTFGLRHIKNLA